MLTQIIPADGFAFISRRMIECQNSGENSNHSSALWTKSFGNVPERRDYLPPTDFRGAWDYQVMQAEEKVALAKALQRCAVCSRMPPGVLCRAVQECHECLASMTHIGNLVDLEILDVAEKDPVAPASKGRSLLLMPRVEPLVGVTTPSELSASEPEEATMLEELTLVPRWRPLPSPGFSLPWADRSNSSPPEKANWPVNVS